VNRPGKMRWDYVDPETKVAIVDGNRTWLYIEEDRQLLLGRIEKETELLPTLLTGGAPLGRLFAAGLLEPAQGLGEGAYRLRLTPKDAGEVLELVILTVNPSSGAIIGAEVLDAAGNRTLYLFSDLVRNGGLRPGLFEFEPPAGTEIAGQH